MTKFQILKIFRNPGSNLALPDNLSQNLTVEIYQKHQLQHKQISRDKKFYDEQGSLVAYRIQHDDNPSDTCNNFYPFSRQRIDNNVLRLRNDGKNFMLNSLSSEFPTATIQSATDCSRQGRTINQCRRSCFSSTQSLNLVEDCEPTYNSINSLSTNESGDVLDEPSNDADPIINDDEYNLIGGINLNADNCRLFKAKEAHDDMLAKIDAYLLKKTLTDMEAPHLDTKSSIAKLDDVAETIDLQVSTILAKQTKNPVLGTVRSWVRKGTSLEPKSPKIQQS